MNKTILTATGRAIFTHLENPQQPSPGMEGKPKYSLTMLFPKNAITTVTGAATSGIVEIQQALEEVCQGTWQQTFANAPIALQMPNAFKIKDGDVDFPKKDANKIPLVPHQTQDNMSGMWVVTFRNLDPVGCAQPSSVAGVNDNIEAKAVYGGCWVRCQVEFAAYKVPAGFVLSGKLLNVLKCYDDTPIGGGKTQQVAATDAFAGVAVTGTNIQVGMNLAPVSAALALAAPVAGITMVAGCQYTYESLSPAWTDDQIVAAGYATKNVVVTPPPVVNAAPPPPPAPLAVVEAVLTTKVGSAHTVEVLLELGWTQAQIITAGHGEMVMSAPPVVVATPPPPPVVVATPPPPPVVVTTPPAPAAGLTMTANSPYTYDQLKGLGWTDQQMVSEGHALAPNFRDAATPPPPPPVA